MSDLQRLRQTYAARAERQANTDLYSGFNPAHLFMRQECQRTALEMLKRNGFQSLANTRILELGCGSGAILVEYLGFGVPISNLFGIDLLPDRIEAARRHLPLPLACADGQHLPYAASTFDLILQYTAFSSILDDTIRTNMADEMLRVLKHTTGLIIWYDFWLNPTNSHTRGIRPPEIRALFPGCQFEFQSITLAPPIARRVVPHSWLLAVFLERLRLFNSHYLVAIRANNA